MSTINIRNAPINLRARPAQRSLIDKACAVLGKNRSDFMLETACREAENVLLDQRFFRLDNAAFDKFESLLAEPVSNNSALRALLVKPAPWEG